MIVETNAFPSSSTSVIIASASAHPELHCSLCREQGQLSRVEGSLNALSALSVPQCDRRRSDSNTELSSADHVSSTEIFSGNSGCSSQNAPDVVIPAPMGYLTRDFEQQQSSSNSASAAPNSVCDQSQRQRINSIPATTTDSAQQLANSDVRNRDSAHAMPEVLGCTETATTDPHMQRASGGNSWLGEKAEGKESETSDRLCDVADDMAGDDQRAEKYIIDIPYSVLLSIYQSLDADKGWESLASETGYTFDKIRLLELEGSRSQGSSSRSLLWELGSRNTTVRQLYGYLNNLSRYREMKILEDYVNKPSRPHFVENGLRGLKSPDSSMDSNQSKSSKGAQSGAAPGPCKKTGAGSMDSFNFNHNHNNHQPQSNCDANNSMKFTPGKDKQYTGKLIPMVPNLSPSPPAPSSPSTIDKNPVSSSGPIAAPRLQPSNPTKSVPPVGAGVSHVHNMLQAGGGGSGGVQRAESSQPSHISSSHPPPSSLSSPSSESPLSSSSLSSLPGLENSFQVRMAVLGSACISYSEVVKATNGFSPRNKIGEGAFGTVYFGILSHNNCAIKKMCEANNQESIVERSTQVQRELSSLLKFRHENIVTLYGYAMQADSLCLVYQFMPNGSLEDRLMCKDSTTPLVWPQRLNILMGACQGLNFLHKMGDQPLIHGDIKSANILLDKHMEAKIGDLGQAQQATARGADSHTQRFTHITKAQTTTKLFGTKAYQAREVQTGGRTSVKSDIFAMGVVILEIFSGERAHDERREGEQFLGEYFESLQTESGNEACLAKIDRRAGDCPREVALAVLDLALECTAQLKKKRPDSALLLQKMTRADELYREKKVTPMDSMPGSEHSCHASHHSSPAPSLDNLAGAPPLCQPPPPPSHQTSPTKQCFVRAEDSPEKKPDNRGSSHRPAPYNRPPDNRLEVNLNLGETVAKAAPGVGSHRQVSQSGSPGTPPSSGPSSLSNPLEYFPPGQQLPPAFRLQQAYDKQCQSQAEKRRIERLSQICDTNEVTAQVQAQAAEQLPRTDPAKLATLEQFDRDGNFHGGEEKEVNSLQSDPRKLEALKRFDETGQETPPAWQDNFGGPDPAALVVEEEEGSLTCDPNKLAYLKQFDGDNVGGRTPLDDGGRTMSSIIVEQTQREEELALASDPRKLATLTQFDAGVQSGQTQREEEQALASDPRKLATLTQFDAGVQLGSPSISSGRAQGAGEESVPLVSELDYVVLPSQQDAPDVCRSVIVPSQQDALDAYQSVHNAANGYNLTSPDSADTEIGVAASAASSVEQVTDGQAEPAQTTADSSLAEETLLNRQKNFFDMYSKLALANMDDDDDFEDDDDGDYENNDDEDLENDGYNEGESCVDGHQEEKISNAVCAAGESLSVQQGVAALVVSGTPTEQDETVLNYFKMREQHYQGTFKKSPQASQC